ncbi:hypothetical protein AVEN_1788-1 [Araneus ventricosus]|uniref:Uncharacterized protein n=1 Tax=Araneus ventricosus TaxID=182803 RepID=A0A4Y2P0Q2_ARAVE|nr:hypothetical protein AVEN_1788-1 [Araneus ventricosus]
MFRPLFERFSSPADRPAYRSSGNPPLSTLNFVYLAGLPEAIMSHHYCSFEPFSNSRILLEHSNTLSSLLTNKLWKGDYRSLTQALRQKAFIGVDQQISGDMIQEHSLIVRWLIVFSSFLLICEINDFNYKPRRLLPQHSAPFRQPIQGNYFHLGNTLLWQQ